MEMESSIKRFYNKRNICPMLEFGVYGRFQQFSCKVTYFKYGDNQVEYLTKEDVEKIVKLESEETSCN